MICVRPIILSIALIGIGFGRAPVVAQSKVPTFEELEAEAAREAEERPLQLTPELRRQIAESLGMSESSPRFQRLMAEAGRPDELGPPELNNQVEESFSVVRHYRGTEGLLLPQGESLVLPEALDEATSEFVGQSVEAIDSYIQRRVSDPLAFPDCKENRTFRLPLNDLTGPEHKNAIGYDMLFVWSGSTVKDIPELFGESVALQQIPRDKPSAEAFAAEAMRVQCIPYRIRITPNAMYFDEGLNSLMNYTGRQEGPGVLDPRAKVFLSQETATP